MCSLSNSIKHYKHILFAKDKINIQLHYVTVNQLASQQMCKCSETDGIVCVQSKNVAVKLYKWTEVMFLMTLLYSQIKIATKTEAAVLDIRDTWLDTALASVVSGWLLYSFKTHYATRGNGQPVA